MKTPVLLLSLCLGLGLTACVGQKDATPVRDDPAQTNTTGTIATENPALEGKRWTLRTLNGQPVQTYPNQPEPHVVFTTEAGQGRVSGSDGCNLLVGSYTANASSMELQHIGTTMMLCPKGADQSRAFMKALGDTTSWQQNGANLELRNASTTLAVFENTAK
ncbi:MAG: META domain-containing protein [Bilophila sp.]